MAQTFRVCRPTDGHGQFMVSVLKDDKPLIIDGGPSVVPMWWIASEYAKLYAGDVK
jgi:hypothetical protein